MHLSEFALTHMSYEKHISEKNELKERERVVAAAVLWEMSWKNDQGSVFITMAAKNLRWKCFCGGKNTEIKIRRAVCMSWKIQSRNFWRKKNVQKICNVQCLPNIYSKLICLILIVVN